MVRRWQLLNSSNDLSVVECQENQISKPSVTVSLDEEKIWNTLQMDIFLIKLCNNVRRFVVILDEATGLQSPLSSWCAPTTWHSICH